MTNFIRAGYRYFNIDYIESIFIEQISFGYVVKFQLKGKDYDIAVFKNIKTCEDFILDIFESSNCDYIDTNYIMGRHLEKDK